MYNCGKGRAFDDLTNSCEAAENVTGCAQFGSNFGSTPSYGNEFNK